MCDSGLCFVKTTCACVISYDGAKDCLKHSSGTHDSYQKETRATLSILDVEAWRFHTEADLPKKATCVRGWINPYPATMSVIGPR